MTATQAPPDWARWTIYGGAGAFGALNLVVSSISIGTLAHVHLGLDIVRSVALALTPDAGALVAGTLWVACTGPLREWGRSVSLGLVGASVVGNAADILAAAGLLPGRALIVLAVALAVAAPVMALLMLHLVLLVKAAPAVVKRAPAKSAARPKGARPGRAASSPEPAAPQQPPPAATPGQQGDGESPEDRKKRLAAQRQARRRQKQREERTAA